MDTQVFQFQYHRDSYGDRRY